MPGITRSRAAKGALFKAVVLFALASAIGCASAEATTLEVHVKGNRLIDASGKPIRLLGVDRAGSEYECLGGSGVFDGPVGDPAIAAIKTWHVNAVRLGLNEDCWLGINLPAGNNYAGEPYRRAIFALVSRLNTAGLYAILDLHWNAPGTFEAYGQQPMADLDHSPAFWKSVANWFKDSPAVLFDLYNEPNSITWECWLEGCTLQNGYGTWTAAGMQQLVKVVRSTGATQPILLGGNNWAGDLSAWLRYEPIDPLTKSPANPVKNQPQLVASYHTYCGTSGDTTVAACQSAMPGEESEWPHVATVAEAAPVVTSEFGEFDCATTYVKPYMAFADSHAISYLGWAWNTYGCDSFPSLVSNYNGTPTAYGIGLKSHLEQLAR